MTGDDFEPDIWPYDHFSLHPFGPPNRFSKPADKMETGDKQEHGQEEPSPDFESKALENPGEDKEEGQASPEKNEAAEESEKENDADIDKNTDYALYPVGTAVPAGSNQPITGGIPSSPVLAQPNNPGQVQYVLPQNVQPNVVPLNNPAPQYTFVNVPNNGGYNPQPNNNVYYVANQPANGGYQVASQPANGGYQVANQPNNGGYQVANQPANGGYQIQNPPTNGGYQVVNQPINGGYQVPNQPINGGYQVPNQPINGGYQIANQPTNGGYQVANPAPTYIWPNNQPVQLVPLNPSQPQYVYMNNPNGNAPNQPTYLTVNPPGNAIPAGNQQYVTLQPTNNGPYLISTKDKSSKKKKDSE